MLVVRRPVPPDAALPATTPSVSAVALAFAHRRVLVADDNRDSAQTLALFLDLIGNETCVAHDGLEAIQAAEAFRPDLVSLDIGMPKLSGHQAARHIRQQPRGATMALVALSGWGQDENRRRSIEAGFDALLVKPWNAPRWRRFWRAGAGRAVATAALDWTRVAHGTRYKTKKGPAMPAI